MMLQNTNHFNKNRRKDIPSHVQHPIDELVLNRNVFVYVKRMYEQAEWQHSLLIFYPDNL